jgi:hypothetical protein
LLYQIETVRKVRFLDLPFETPLLFSGGASTRLREMLLNSLIKPLPVSQVLSFPFLKFAKRETKPPSETKVWDSQTSMVVIDPLLFFLPTAREFTKRQELPVSRAQFLTSFRRPLWE